MANNGGYWGAVIDNFGRVISGVSINVYLTGTTNLATIYINRAGSALANPFTSEADGSFNFFADVNNRYDIAFSKAGFTFDNTDLVDVAVDSGSILGTNNIFTGTNTFNAAVTFGSTTTFQAGDIQTAELADDSVTDAKLRDDATTDANRAVTTNHIRDSAITNAKIVAAAGIPYSKLTLTNSLVTGDLVDANITQSKIAKPAVGTPELKTSTGVATSGLGAAIDVTMNDYSFAPSLTNDNANVAVQVIVVADPGNTIGRLRLAAQAGAISTARWRYITSSDNPAVWVSYDGLGNILAVWMSDDPTPDGSPGVTSPGGVSIQIPLSQLAPLSALASRISRDGGLAKATSPDKAHYRILWEEHPNPAKAVIDNMKVNILTQRLEMK